MSGIIITVSLDELLDKLESRISSKLVQPAPVSNDKDEVVTEGELCKFLNLSRPTVRAKREAGLIPYMSIGKAIRYNKKAVLKALGK